MGSGGSEVNCFTGAVLVTLLRQEVHFGSVATIHDSICSPAPHLQYTVEFVYIYVFVYIEFDTVFCDEFDIVYSGEFDNIYSDEFDIVYTVEFDIAYSDEFDIVYSEIVLRKVQHDPKVWSQLVPLQSAAGWFEVVQMGVHCWVLFTFSFSPSHPPPAPSAP